MSKRKPSRGHTPRPISPSGPPGPSGPTGAPADSRPGKPTPVVSRPTAVAFVDIGVQEVLVLVGVVIVGLLLAFFFLRAMGEGVEKQRVGRLNKIHALCDEALRGDPGNPMLGSFPTDAPDFRLADYAGRSTALSDLRGRVVLVNFWATWCPTCVVEMPSMERLVSQMSYGGHWSADRANQAPNSTPFTLLAVSVDDGWPQVRNFFHGGTPLTVLLDSEKKTPPLYGTEKFPETYIVDKDGKVLYYVVSDRDWSAPDIRACMNALVE